MIPILWKIYFPTVKKIPGSTITLLRVRRDFSPPPPPETLAFFPALCFLIYLFLYSGPGLVKLAKINC